MATIRDMEIDELVTGYACSLDGCTYEYLYFFDSREQAENACRKAFAGEDRRQDLPRYPEHQKLNIHYHAEERI